MNVRVLRRGDDPTATPPPPGMAADGPAAAESLAPVREPQSVGDRLRTMLSSGDSTPLYPRVLRLQHIHPNGWQRALLVEGMMVAGALVALADRATAWAPVVLPAGAAAIVKFHDVLAGLLPQRPPVTSEDAGNDSAASPESGNAAENG